jgi:cyclopropane fatty-acyl-phospholipid synthase-like methyltransferase
VTRALKSARYRITLLLSPESRRHAKVGPLENWREKREFQLRFLRDHGLQPGQTLLDLGCGTLRGGIPIIDYLDAGNYTGLEARPPVLDEAREELRAHNLEHKRPALVVNGDLATFELDRRFDMIWAFSVLIHMSDDVLDGALGFVSRHLGDHGVFFANITTEERKDKSWEGFPDVARPVSFYETRARAHGLTVENMGPLKTFGHPSGHGAEQQMLRFTRLPA